MGTGPPDDGLCIFARPVRLSVAGSGRTEWGFPNAPPIDRLQEHGYRLTVSEEKVGIEVDGHAIGVAHDIKNPSGGLLFSAYSVSVEIRDVTVTALAPPEAVPDPAIPVDLPSPAWTPEPSTWTSRSAT